ncbi:TRAP transporter small permease subunit [Labrenzia suaedae]|uniref:TRAP transporter small permease subunit n=2 Tax=Roseibium litorale TaxID=2803841 RepID=A0ABR9CMT9_9HYPH|nr:TRAP transporter small permease subunit [Roseibium litorale]
MMAAMFATFILQVMIRYTARIGWVAETFPWLEPSNFGWTLEFCLALWLWLVFWGNSFVVRDQDHVSFDILYFAVSGKVRRGFIIVTGLAIAIGLLLSIDPTWDRFKILRLKKTATLSDLFGDWIRMRDIYAIYILFLITVPARYLWLVWQAFRSSMRARQHTSEGRLDE